MPKRTTADDLFGLITGFDNDLRNPPWVDLSRQSDAPQVDALCDRIDGMCRVVGLTGWQDRVRKPLVVWVLNLLVRHRQQPGAWLKWSQDNNNYGASFYNPAGISRKFIEVGTYLWSAGLIEIKRGTQAKGGKRVMSRARATPRLIELLDEYGLTLADTAWLPDLPLVIIRVGKRKVMQESHFSGDDAEVISATKGLLEAYNDLTERTVIELPSALVARCDADLTQRRLVRIFNRGQLTHGGRYYRPWWQSVPGELRPMITINGDQTSEYDYKSQIAILAYAMKGIDYRIDERGDPYLLTGAEYDAVPKALLRPLGKMALTVALNMDDSTYLEGAIRTAWWREKLDRKAKARGITPVGMVEAMRLKHPDIADLFVTGIGLRTQRIDSEICTVIMRALTAKSIPVLTIHDSFIVARQHGDLLHGLMVEAHQEVMMRMLGLRASPPAIEKVQTGFAL